MERGSLWYKGVKYSCKCETLSVAQEENPSCAEGQIYKVEIFWHMGIVPLAPCVLIPCAQVNVVETVPLWPSMMISNTLTQSMSPDSKCIEHLLNMNSSGVHSISSNNLRSRDDEGHFRSAYECNYLPTKGTSWRQRADKFVGALGFLACT